MLSFECVTDDKAAIVVFFPFLVQKIVVVVGAHNNNVTFRCRDFFMSNVSIVQLDDGTWKQTIGERAKTFELKSVS